MSVQLAGARDNAPFSVEITGPDGDKLFSDSRFLMDYKSRDPKHCAEMAKQFKDKLSEAVPSSMVTVLPSSFLESHLSTKIEYERSLQLAEDARLQAESEALTKKIEAMKLATSRSPTASVASSSVASSRSSRLDKYLVEAERTVDVSDGCCGAGGCS